MLSCAGFSSAAIVALCGALLVEGHGYASNINIAGVRRHFFAQSVWGVRINALFPIAASGGP